MGVLGLAGFDYYEESVGNYEVVYGTGRGGGGALRKKGTGSYNGYPLPFDFNYGAPSAYSTVDQFAFRPGHAGVWASSGLSILSHKISGGAPILFALTTGSSGDLKLWKWFNNSGGTKTLIATMSGVLTDPDVFDYIEMKIDWDTSDCYVTVRVNGSVVLATATGVGRSWFDEIFHIFFRTEVDGSPSAYDMYVDDIIVLDSLGTYATDYLGDRAVSCLVPTADGTYYEWLPGSGSHYDKVNELPHDGDGTYVNIGPSPGGVLTDTYAMSDIPTGSSAVVPAVQFVLVSRNIDATPIDIDVWGHIKSGADEADTDPSSVFDTWKNLTWLYPSNPFLTGTQAWTVGVLNALEFGPASEVLTATLAEPAVTGVYIEYITPDAVISAIFSFGTIVGL